MKSSHDLVFIVADDVMLAKELAVHIESKHFRLQQFRQLRDFAAAYAQEAPTVVIMDTTHTENEAVYLQALVKMQQVLTPCPPVIYISNRSDIENRLAAARIGISRYFCNPIDLKELFQSLANLVKQTKERTYRVLLIDDTVDIASYYGAVLEKAGLQVKTLSDPLSALDVLADFKPDLLFLDVYMPGCSGPELAKVIRQDSSFEHMPIIFLSSELDFEEQLDALKQGGDEFLTKPISARDLIAAANIRIKRARSVNQLNQNLKDALRESEFRRITLDQHAITSITDVTGKITFINDKFCSISGYSQEELLGQNHRILNSGQHSASFFENLWDTISQGNIWHGTICNRCKDGSRYWVESTIVPFLDESGLPYQYVSARTDITEVRTREERLHRSQVFANIGTWDWNIKTGELYWSERIGPLFGYNDKVPETTYENFIAAVHPEDRQKVIDAISACVGFGADYNIEHRVVWPDGSVHWVMENGDVVRNKHGKATQMLGVVQDITRRKMAESILLLHKTAMDSSAEGIAIVDIAGKYTYLNPALAHIFGYKEAKDLLGTSWSSHYSADELTRFDEEIMPCIILSHQWSGEAVGTRRDGSSFPHTLSMSTLDDGCMVCIVHDITESKQIEADLLNAKEAAESANIAKSQFLSSMSHELRTPMNAIIGFSQLLQLSKELDSKQSDNVSEILKAGNHLLTLINEVLDLSGVESGHIELSMEPVMFGEVLMECMSLIAPLAQENNISITIEQDGAEISPEQAVQSDLSMQADRIRLKQALINLLNNAVKYNFENGNITISTTKTDEWVRVDIIDTGPGIPEDQQSQLFQAFNRLGAEQSEIEGTGIGLVYTKNIIELMGGKIGAVSASGMGSTFWIELPRTVKPINAVIHGEKKNEYLHERLTQEHQFQHTILYVEDNPANLRLVTRIMAQHGHNINLLCTSEPMQGVVLAKEQNPDLIMLDINLPGMDGFEILEILRNNKVTADTPVIAISANVMPKDIERGLAAGFRHYISKPIDIKQLLSIINNTLS